MKHAKLMGGLAALLAATAMQPAAAAWRVLASQGVRHFVTTDGQAGEAVYRQAAQSVCAAGQPCIVLVWNDAGQAASKMPMTKEQQESLAAQYTRNPATGSDSLRLKCAAGSPPKGNCLK
jgi:hypothetical protein